MKIRIQDGGLVALGFITGVVCAFLLTRTPTQPPPAPASSVVATGFVLVAASPQPHLITLTNAQWKAPPIYSELPPQLVGSVDAESLLNPAPRRPMDLIDLRYQSDFKLDDLK